MKLKFILFFISPIIIYCQINIGNNQTICSGDSIQISAIITGSASGCSGVSDSLITPVLGGNGSAGTIFNIINTSGSPLEITGISQGGTYSMTNNPMEVWLYPGDVYANPLPVGSPPYPGWSLVGTANINTTGGNSLGYIPVNGVTIPAGGIYSFRVQRLVSGSVSYTNGTGNAGVTTWASDANITITEGHGGGLTDWFAFSPRGFNGAVHYGGGANWYNLNTGQTIGTGDSIIFSPSQSTNICATINCNGITYSDTITVDVLNTDISTSGFSLCNGPVILTAPMGFINYNWNSGSSSSIYTVNTPGSYYVTCISQNGLSCQSEPVNIFQGNIPINLSTPDSIYICQGDTVIIEGPPGFSQYNWNTGANSSNIITDSTGNYSLSVVDANGCTGTSNTTTISISPQSITANTTGFSLCNGSVTLDAGSGFSSYQWYNNGTMLPNGTNQTYIVNTAGNYSVEVIYPTGCTATSNTLTIYSATSQFYLFINAIGEDSLCMPNGQLILDAGNFASYSWNTGEITQQITVNSIGSFYVNVVDANGCSGVSNPPFNVANIVNTSTISGPNNPTQYQTVNYSVLPNNGSTYQWNIIGGTIQSGQGTNSVDVIWNNSGAFIFSVTETDINGCIGEEVSLLVNVIFSAEENILPKKELIKITDILGRESNYITNKIILYIYDDGTIERKLITK
ncbi:MAG: hypothetical protein CMP51_03630 [Flavobacteriales bacterium]|nr:hypothetical protein [Flavobacteriales bacterium]